jgi:hypothetical protein
MRDRILGVISRSIVLLVELAERVGFEPDMTL